MAKNIVGQFIPNVFINKITLESGGHTPRPYDDPHIDEASSIVSTGFTAGEYGATNSSGTSNIKVTLDLSIKEYILPDGLSTTWFNDLNAYKYFKIFVFESRNPLITKAIMLGDTAAEVMLGLSLSGVPASYMYSVKKAGSAKGPMIAKSPAVVQSKVLGEGITSNNMKKDLEAIYGKETNIFSEKLSTLILQNGDVKNNYKTTLDDGTVLYSIPLTVYMDDVPDNILNLSYFATVIVDTDALEKEFNVEPISPIPHGRITGEIVFENGATVSKAYGFFDLSGAPWVGPTHQLTPGKWMSGVTSGPGSKELVRKFIANYKVQDFRHVNAIDRLKLDLSVVENKVLLARSKTKALTFDAIGKKNSYFSDCLISRDSDNNARFLFAFDLGSYIKDNSVFGALYDGTLNNIFPGLLNEIVRIKSFKLIRRRVKDTWTMNKAANYVSRNTVFDKDVPYTTIILTEDTKLPSINGFFELVAIDGIKGGISEVKIFDSFVASTTQAGSNAGIRYFSGTDRVVSFRGSGLYQYGVELEIEDRTAAVIQNTFIKSLRNTLNGEDGLRWYLNEATKHGQMVSGDPSSPKLRENTNFDVISNRFTQKFITQMGSKFGNDGALGLTTPWGKAVQVYTSFLKTFFGTQAQQIADELLIPLVVQSAPRTGTPRGIMNLIKLIENLISLISSMAGMNKSKVKEISSITAGNVHSHSPTSRISKIEHFFHSAFDAGIPPKVGFDYLSTTGLLRKERGVKLKTVTELEYRNRTVLEKTNITSGININTMLEHSGFLQDFLTDATATYLALSNVNLGPGRFYNLVPFVAGTAILSSYNPPVSSKNVDDEDIPFSRMMAEVVAYNRHQLTQSPPASSLPLSIPANLVPDVHDQARSRMPLADSRLAGTLTQAFDAVISGRSAVVSSTRDRINARGAGPGHRLAEQHDITRSIPGHVNEDTIDWKHSQYNPDDPGSLAGQMHKIYDTNPNRFLLRLLSLENFSLSKHNEAMKNFNGWLTNAAKAVNIQAVKPGAASGMDGLNDPAFSERFGSAPMKLKQLIAAKMSMTAVKNKEGLSLEVTPEGLSTDPMHFAALMFKYGHVRKIEAFAGFQMSPGGTAMVNAPTWTPLGLHVIENVPKGKYVLCRIRDYDYRQHVGGTVSPLEPPEIMNLPIYNEYFLIQASSLKSAAMVMSIKSKSMFVQVAGAAKTKIMNASSHINASAEYYQTAWPASAGQGEGDTGERESAPAGPDEGPAPGGPMGTPDTGGPY